MSILEMISGGMLIVSCLLIIVLVALQSEKGNGLSGAIMGGEQTAMHGEFGKRTKQLAKITKICAVAFFVLTLVVNLINLSA